MSASDFLVFRKKRASCVPNTVPNSSKLITLNIRYFIFYMRHIERLRPFSVKQHSFMPQIVHSQQLFPYEGENDWEDLLISYFPYLYKLYLCGRSNILKGDKTPGQILSYPVGHFP